MASNGTRGCRTGVGGPAARCPLTYWSHSRGEGGEKIWRLRKAMTRMTIDQVWPQRGVAHRMNRQVADQAEGADIGMPPFRYIAARPFE